MTAVVTESDVRDFIVGQLSEPLLGVHELPQDFDLLAEGVIDSFGFLELVLALEGRYDMELDLDDLDPDDLTRLGPLSEYVAGQVDAR